MEQPKCADCRFFTRPGMPGDKYGACVRFPQPYSKHESIDWCGEFQRVQIDVPLREPAKVSKPKS